MNSLDTLPLFHSWPLFDAAEHLGRERMRALGLMAPKEGEPVAQSDIGLWTCDLANDNALRWSPQVYALFGLPDGEPLTRSLAVSLYEPRSRAAMEELRAHAIHHRRGFTMDGMIRQPNGDLRWMRLSAMPVLGAGKVVGLCGTKQDVTAEYDGPGWQRF